MKRLKTMAVIFGLVFLFGGFPRSAKADESNKKTVVTINEPFEIPGKVLAPGKYVFKLMDNDADRHIVQIFNAEENHVYATILAVPSYRFQPTDKTVITFWERAKDTPEALRTWFYPGDEYGQEFVYPKAKALEIAKSTQHPVVAMPATMSPNPSPAELKKAPLVAVKPNSEEVHVAQVTKPSTPLAVAPKTLTQVATAQPMKHLPKTASPLPLIGLIGLLSLVGAGTLRLRRCRQR